MAREKRKPPAKKEGIFSRLKKRAAKQKQESFFGTRAGSTKADPLQLASARKYKVKSGDTLSQIARDYGVSLEALKKNTKLKMQMRLRLVKIWWFRAVKRQRQGMFTKEQT